MVITANGVDAMRSGYGPTNLPFSKGVTETGGPMYWPGRRTELPKPSRGLRTKRPQVAKRLRDIQKNYSTNEDHHD